MSPKEKAEELINKFIPHADYWDCRNDEPLEEDHAKECALICVDEIISAIIEQAISHPHLQNIGYWEKVKKHIEEYPAAN
jgi:hypothetical protein